MGFRQEHWIYYYNVGTVTVCVTVGLLYYNNFLLGLQ